MAVLYWFHKHIEALRRNPHRLLLGLFDGLTIAIALWLAYQMRLDFRLGETEYWRQYLSLVFFVAAGRIAIFYFFGLYKGLSRYAGMHEMLALIMGAATGTLLLGFFNLISRLFPALGPLPLHPSGEHVLRIPWGVIGIEFFTASVGVGGLRVLRRMLLSLSVRSSKDARRALIVGAGDAGELVARDLLKSPEIGIRPVAFIDQDSRLWGRHIHGLPVVGHIHTLKQTLALYRVDEILIALPSASPRLLREIVDECEKNHVTFKTVPSVKDLMEGKITISAIRSVEIEDLLGREPVRMTLPSDQNYLAGEHVLITGAGGSIGSELCRQALACGPEELLLVGRGENSIHEIATELAMVKTQTVIR
ncbi:MAG: polysaccharide biosynthesis protein, partial [bacterium]